MRDIKVGSVQFCHTPGNKAENLKLIEKFLKQAAAQNVEMVIFPEMCITGYWHVRKLTKPQIENIAEPVPQGPSTEKLLSLSKEYGLTVGAGLIERGDNGKLYNSYIVAMSNGDYACHRKLHCFISEHMHSGENYTVFDTPHGCRAGIPTCYDNNIIENVRINALKGVEVLIAPHQTGGCDSRSPQAMGVIDPKLWHEREKNPDAIEEEFKGHKGRGWLMRWLPSRAHDNGMFLVFSNGVGLDDDEVRTGNAMILDPYGRVLAETWKAQDCMVVADLKSELLQMCTGRRWIRGRKPYLYGMLSEEQGNEYDPRSARFSSNRV
ncbi:acyltransferase [Chitinispirillum alkaliphilum]|nr:acyltransferase [Chitinispirillum alkaliphilum]